MARRISLTRVSKLHRASNSCRSQRLSIQRADMQKTPFAGVEIARSFSRWTKDESCFRPLFILALLPRKTERERARARCNHLRPSRVESNGAIIRTFANQLGERCENYRREMLSRLSCPLGMALEETGRLRALNSWPPSKGERCLEIQV